MKGRRIKLVVRGFASPLAKSDYNVNLSLRRIQSMINYLRTVDDGAFMPYLDGTAANGGGSPSKRRRIGEYKAVEGVSDALADLQEQRLQRERFARTPHRDRTGGPDGTRHERQRAGHGHAGKERHRHWHVLRGEPQEAGSVVRNDGSAPLHLLSSKADCGCTTATVGQAPDSTREAVA